MSFLNSQWYRNPQPILLCSFIKVSRTHYISFFSFLKNNHLKKTQTQPKLFFKQMPKLNEASSLTEDYVDDVAKHSECDSSSIKENKKVYASKLNRSF